MQKVLALFISWRLILILPLALGNIFIAPRIGYLAQNPWANFDGLHYLAIAENGYISQAAFFPLYPLIIKLFSYLFANNFLISALLISNLAFIFSLYYLYKLFKIDYPDKNATLSIIFLLIYPLSFFFGSVYSESIFLLLLVLSFYLARKKQWLLSGIAASLLCATRLVGIFIIPALIYEYYHQNKKINLKLMLPSLSLATYSFYNYLHWGKPFYFIQAHSELNNSRSVNSIILFPQTLYRYFRILFDLNPVQFEWQIALLELIIFIATLFLLCYAWYKKVNLSYLIFSFLAFLLPASSGTFSGLPRYTTILFPIYLSLTFLPPKVKYIYSVISPLLMLILSAYFLKGFFIA